MNRVALLMGVGSLAATSAALYFFNRKKQPTATPTLPAPATGNVNQPNYPLNPTANIFTSISDGVMSLLSEPRGIRNNNPLNIRWNAANNWNGQTGKDSGGFSIFDNPVNGIRAAARILDNYAKRGITTVAQIISTWAPADDNNNVEAYISHVVSATGIARNTKVTRANYLALLRVMIKHENGKQPYTDAQILAGINAA